jgi:hypothetical protein
LVANPKYLNFVAILKGNFDAPIDSIDALGEITGYRRRVGGVFTHCREIGDRARAAVSYENRASSLNPKQLVGSRYDVKIPRTLKYQVRSLSEWLARSRTHSNQPPYDHARRRSVRVGQTDLPSNGDHG